MITAHDEVDAPPTLAPGLVSVQIPVRNGGRFLDEAIRSVLAQQYPHWELIVADDGSSDDSLAIARRFADRDPDRVRVLVGPDPDGTGISATRNRALAVARGEFTAFLDADDWIDPAKLRRQVASLRRHTAAAMVAGATEWWVRWDPTVRARDHVVPLGRRGLFSGPTALALLLRQRIASPATCAVMVRTSLAREAEGFEEEFTGLYEDQVFYAKMLLRAPIVLAPRVVARYRQHADSITNSRSKARHEEVRRLYLEWLDRAVRERESHLGESASELLEALDYARSWIGRGPAVRRAHRFVLKRVRRIRSWTGG